MPKMKDLVNELSSGRGGGNRSKKEIVPSIRREILAHGKLEDGEFALDISTKEIKEKAMKTMLCSAEEKQAGYKREWVSFFWPYSRPFRRLFEKRAKTILNLCKMALDDKNLSVSKARKTLEEIQHQLNS